MYDLANAFTTKIDHICIGQKLKRSLLDVRGKRGAGAASDHHPVVGKLQIKLRRFADNNARTKYNVVCLKERDVSTGFKFCEGKLASRGGRHN